MVLGPTRSGKTFVARAKEVDSLGYQQEANVTYRIQNTGRS